MAPMILSSFEAWYLSMPLEAAALIEGPVTAINQMTAALTRE
jgi:hypothetical protein